MTENISTDFPMNVTDDDNLTANLTADDYEYPIWYDVIAIGLLSLFAITFVVGIVGNGILIFTVLRNKPMRTKPNILIVNLAISDFILILFVPLTFVISAFVIYAQWSLSNAICKLYASMQTLFLGLSVFTLTALSVDRFIAIVFPLASYTSSRSLTRVIVASVVIWVFSAGLAIMDLVGAHVSGEDVKFCSVYPDEWGQEYKKFRVIFRFIVYFAVPLIVIFCLYVSIAVVLRRQAFQPGYEIEIQDLPSVPSVTRGHKVSQRSENVAMAKQNETRRKIAKIVLSFVVIFIVCCLPTHVSIMCIFFKSDHELSIELIIVAIVGLWLTFVNSAINPLALYLLCAEYRRYVHHYLFACCHRHCRLRTPTATETARCHRIAGDGKDHQRFSSALK